MEDVSWRIIYMRVLLDLRALLSRQPTCPHIGIDKRDCSHESSVLKRERCIHGTGIDVSQISFGVNTCVNIEEPRTGTGNTCGPCSKRNFYRCHRDPRELEVG